MFKNSKILALIPARAGSKGIKGKNIRLLGGKPLIAYTIDAALNSKYIDDVIVSTDSKRIAAISIEYGAKVPFIRPGNISGDRAKSIDVVLHAISEYHKFGMQFDIIVLLQPTSPLRIAVDIDRALEVFFSNEQNGVVSVSEVQDNPLLIRSINKEGTLCKILQKNSSLRRQEMPKYYRVNGAIYINMISDINSKFSLNDNKTPYIMERSHSVDIDTIDDFEYAEWLMRKNNI